MPRTLVTAERQLGERCCDRSARPSISSPEAARLAGQLQLLSHPVRLQLLDVLARNEGGVCVCDLEGAVPVKQPTVSHHLRILREAGVIDAERVGQWMYYRIRRDALVALRGRLGSLFDVLL
jgi:ArsR family transcriptional regulator